MSSQERIPSIIYQLSLAAKQASQLNVARVVLLSAGLGHHDISDADAGGKPTLNVFKEDQRTVKQLHVLFKKLALTGVTATINTLRPKDWLTRWKDHWKPARLTAKLDVVPVWYKDQYKIKAGRDYILMDTLLSFGTGLHETTQIMAQFIEDNAGQYRSFLDIGTGTGILAIVAIKNGAKDVCAVDIGELSVSAAKDNMKVNGVKATVKLADIKTLVLGKKYDFVAANLITHDLIAHAPQILKFLKPGGLLAISGISLENLDKLNKVFKALPIKLLETVKGQTWSGQLYVKKMF